MEAPIEGYFRLAPNKEVRLRNAYDIKCKQVIKNDKGEVIEIRCEYDPDSKGKNKKKLKGIIHWVSAKHALSVETRLYDRLFSVPNPASAEDITATLNDQSLIIHQESKIEPHAKNISIDDRMQFERQGYFCLDDKLTSNSKFVFNRIVTLRDIWAKK